MEKKKLSEGGYAYIFEAWEESEIRNALIPIIPRLEKKIKKVDDDPKNEGQADFLDKLDELKRKKKNLTDIIVAFHHTS